LGDSRKYSFKFYGPHLGILKERWRFLDWNIEGMEDFVVH